jgi:hypothetical protein
MVEWLFGPGVPGSLPIRAEVSTFGPRYLVTFSLQIGQEWVVGGVRLVDRFGRVG